MNYEGFDFISLSDQNLARKTSKKLSYESAGPWTPERAQNDSAHFRGALLQLFGSPQYSSSRADEALDYIIRVTNQQGSAWILTAYEGASGPAIGGPIFDETCYPAAQALINLIAATKPADFEATIYDDDTDNTVTYGIKDGQAFHHERRGEHASGRSE